MQLLIFCFTPAADASVQHRSDLKGAKKSDSSINWQPVV
jgi:hypothetical protein